MFIWCTGQSFFCGRAVHRPYSDSEESDNDVLYAEEENSALTQSMVDLCGEGCAQLDDFKWFLPTDVRVGDLNALESEIKISDSESGVDFIEPDPTPLQKVMQQCPGDCVGDLMSRRRTIRWRWMPDKCPPLRIQ